MFDAVFDIFIEAYLIHDYRLFYIFLRINNLYKKHLESYYKKIMIKYCFLDLVNCFPITNNHHILNTDLIKVFNKTEFTTSEIVLINTRLISISYKDEIHGNLFLTRKDGLIVRLPSVELYMQIVNDVNNSNEKILKPELLLLVVYYTKNFIIRNISYEINDAYLKILERDMKQKLT